MYFKEWLLLEKYVTTRSVYCDQCKERLFPLEVVDNPKHIYRYGQLWKCGCGTSKLWTNSVRNPEAFIESLNSSQPYAQGFCNDKFCGFCFAKMSYPTKNGVEASFPYPNRMDLWTCPNGHNQDLLMDGHREGGEGDIEPIERWWRRYAFLLKEIMMKSKK